jgi:hypothetical protein
MDHPESRWVSPNERCSCVGCGDTGRARYADGSLSTMACLECLHREYNDATVEVRDGAILISKPAPISDYRWQKHYHPDGSYYQSRPIDPSIIAQMPDIPETWYNVPFWKRLLRSFRSLFFWMD